LYGLFYVVAFIVSFSLLRFEAARPVMRSDANRCAREVEMAASGQDVCLAVTDTYVQCMPDMRKCENAADSKW
jgi:hypothetical protein